MSELEDKVAGSLLGFAIGDALGLPLDGLSIYQTFNLYHSTIDGYFPDKRRGTPPGQYGPQTVCALAFAKSIADSGKINPETIIQAEDIILKHSRAKYEYPTLFARSAVVGLVAGVKNYSDQELANAIKTWRDNCNYNIDWTDSLACLMFAFVIREIIARPELYKNPIDLYDGAESLLERVCVFCRNRESKKEDLKEELSARLESCRHKLMENESDSTRFVGIHGSGPGAPEILATSFFCYFRAPDSHETIFDAVSTAGAASMRGSIVGALVGATIGASYFQQGMKDTLSNGANIVLLGERIAKCLMAPSI